MYRQKYPRRKKRPDRNCTSSCLPGRIGPDDDRNRWLVWPWNVLADTMQRRGKRQGTSCKAV